MTRSILTSCAALIVSVAACDGKIVGPKSAAGSYTLSTAEGQSVPARLPFFSIGADTTFYTFHSGQYTLRDDGTYSEVLVISAPRAPLNQQVTTTGTWTQQGSRVTLTLPSTTFTTSAVVHDNTLTTEYNFYELVFKK